MEGVCPDLGLVPETTVHTRIEGNVERFTLLRANQGPNGELTFAHEPRSSGSTRITRRTIEIVLERIQVFASLSIF